LRNEEKVREGKRVEFYKGAFVREVNIKMSEK